jgi:hypothetical protein
MITKQTTQYSSNDDDIDLSDDLIVAADDSNDRMLADGLETRARKMCSQPALGLPVD